MRKGRLFFFSRTNLNCGTQCKDEGQQIRSFVTPTVLGVLWVGEELHEEEHEEVERLFVHRLQVDAAYGHVLQKRVATKYNQIKLCSLRKLLVDFYATFLKSRNKKC